MTDNVDVTPGTGATIATDDVAGVQYQRVKVDLGGDGAASPLVRGLQTKANSLPVVIASDQTVTVDASGAAVPVTDNGGSLTVDGSVAVTQATGTNLHAVIDSGTVSTITNVVHVDDNSGNLSIDDGGNSITVDGTVTASIAAGATTIAKAEDGVHADGDVGVMALAVRKNTAASTSGSDGDYQPLITNTTGHLWVDASGQTLTVGSHAVTNVGTFAVQATIADAADATLGAKADAKSTATDTTAVSAMSVLKQISASVQAPPSQAVTNAGTFAVQAAVTAASGSFSSGALASGSVASGAVASGAFASGSIASGAIASGAIAAGAIAAGATSIADNEDAVSGDGDRGVKVLAVRKASPANTSGTDGDYEFLQMSAGRIWASATVDAALPTGTNTIGSFKITDGTTVPDVIAAPKALKVGVVDASGTQITSFGGGTQYAEDVASAGAELLNLAGAKRQDTPAANANVSADADFTQLIVDNTGQLWIAGAYKEDQAASDGDRGLVPLAKRQDTPAANANVSADGDYAPLLVDNLGQLWIAGAYKEDQASGDGDRGIGNLAVRKATPANTSGSDGDYEFLQMSAGRLWTSANIDQINGVTPLMGNGATGTGALRVSIANDSTGIVALTTGSAVIGQTTGAFVTVSTSVTRIATTTAYTANDCWSDSSTAPTSGGFTFTSAGRASGGSGIITDMIVSSSNDPATLLQGEIWISDSAIATNDVDNAAFTYADADALLLVAVIPFTLASTVAGSGSTSYAHIQNLNIGFTCVGTAHLRFKVKVKNAYTPASSEVLNVRLKIIQVT